MPEAFVAAGHSEPDENGDGRKIAINILTEPNEDDPLRTRRHIMRPGSLDLDTGGTLTTIPRGIAQTDGHANGKILIAEGSQVHTYNPTTTTWSAALSGTIAGTDRVQFVFSENEGGVLANGTIHVSDGSSIAAATDADWATLLSDHGQTAFTSIETIGQRLIATYGSRFAFSDALDFNETSTISWYTAESSPDGLVGCIELHNSLYMLGSKTIERWVQTGNNDDPFRPQTNAVINRGCAARDTIKEIDNTFCFVGDDRNVYRLAGQVPIAISEPWVTRQLKLEDPADLQASIMEFDKHALYIVGGILGTYAFDFLTQEWFRWKSYDEDAWQWFDNVRVGSKFYGISGLDADFAELSRSYKSDLKPDASTYADPIVMEFSAHLPVKGGRRKVGSVRIDGTKGRGAAADLFTDAYVAMAISRDGGRTQGPYRQRSIGKQGEYRKRAIWRQNGRSREPSMVFFFRTNDPQAITSVMVGED